MNDVKIKTMTTHTHAYVKLHTFRILKYFMYIFFIIFEYIYIL